MAATSKTYRVVRGQTWVREVYRVTVVDDVETASPLTTPAMMDIREGRPTTSTLVVRLDSTPAAGEGSIVTDGLPRGGLVLTLDDAILETLPLSPSGGWYFDLWARLASAPTVPVLVLTGRFVLTGRTTDEIETAT